jgi:hypothetical protein
MFGGGHIPTIGHGPYIKISSDLLGLTACLKRRGRVVEERQGREAETRDIEKRLPLFRRQGKHLRSSWMRKRKFPFQLLQWQLVSTK